MTLSTATDSFQRKYIPVTESGCWLWMAYSDKDGYGRFTPPRPERNPLAAHRFSWLLHRGPIPDGLMVLHHCDVRACVNPAHLFLGTQAINLADQRQKGRKQGSPPLKTHCVNGHALAGDNLGWRRQRGYLQLTRYCKLCDHLRNARTKARRRG